MKKPPEKPTRQRGTDPKFDEQMLLSCLEGLPTVENIGSLQSGAMLALIDCYDRKVDREFFGAVAAAALALHTAMGRLYTTAVMKNIVKQPQFKADPDKEMQGIMSSLTDHAAKRQAELSQMVHLLVQCPTGADAIN